MIIIPKKFVIGDERSVDNNLHLNSGFLINTSNINSIGNKTINLLTVECAATLGIVGFTSTVLLTFDADITLVGGGLFRGANTNAFECKGINVATNGSGYRKQDIPPVVVGTKQVFARINTTIVNVGDHYSLYDDPTNDFNEAANIIYSEGFVI